MALREFQRLGEAPSQHSEIPVLGHWFLACRKDSEGFWEGGVGVADKPLALEDRTQASTRLRLVHP